MRFTFGPASIGLATVLALGLRPALDAGGPPGAPGDETPGTLRAGFGSFSITPPAGTPSAGYGARLGGGMAGAHDPLEADALVLATPEKTLVLVGVDSLGFDSSMVEEVRAAARAIAGIEKPELHLGSSHTHAGGGAFIPYPAATILFGIYSSERRNDYIQGTVEAVRRAAAAMRPARLGVGYRKLEGLNRYRGKWPPRVTTNPWLSLLKVEGADGRPLAALFVYAAHPTVLGADNRQFSADFVGYARRAAAERIGGGVGCVYFNGAQGDVSPAVPSAPPGTHDQDRFQACERMGASIGAAVAALWTETPAKGSVLLETERIAFQRPFRPSSSGYTIATGDHSSEMNGLVLDHRHLFLTVPGELSAIYDERLRQWGEWLGYEHATVLGLTDDAIGYIITPESYRHRTYESTVSFSGPDLGPFVEEKALELFHRLEPEGAFNGSRGQPPAASPAGARPAGKP